MVRLQSKTSGTDHNVMRELNRSLVLDLLKDRSPISRAAIAKATDLAKPTVSAIVDDLLRDGLVSEVGIGATTTGGGRPPILLDFNARSRFVAGVRIGVRRTTVVVADARGDEIGQVVEPTPEGRPADQVKQVAALVKSALRQAGAPADRLAAVGVAVPAIADVREPFARAFGRVPVFVHNTPQAAAVAEHVDGAGKGASVMVLLHLGATIGTGVLVDGRLYDGTGGVAGALGQCHVPGGSLETVASAPAIAKAAQQAARSEPSVLSPKRTVRPEDVITAAHAGDKVALRVLAEAGRTLGIALSWVVNLLDPEVVVVGGSFVDAGEPLLDPLRRAALEYALPHAAARVSIRESVLGESAEVRGAVLLALQCSHTYYRVMFQG